MYKKYVKNDFLKYLNLKDYQVQGVLSYGGMRMKKHYSELKDILKKLGYEVKYEIIQENGFYENIIVLNINDKKIWYDTVYGGTYLSEMLHLACFFGSKKNIHIGSCGGLVKGGNAGDIVIGSASYGNESTTRMYQPSNKEFLYYPDKNLTNSIKNRIDNKYKIIEGKLMTCQAALIESWEDIIQWSTKEYIGVDMESSCIFAVSNYFHVPAATVVYIADNLIIEETLMDKKIQSYQQLFQEVTTELFRVALAELLD